MVNDLNPLNTKSIGLKKKQPEEKQFRFPLKRNTLLVMAMLFFFLAFPFTSLAQQTVTGVVTDGRTGETLVGATVRIKDTSLGTVTDINGFYSIQVADPDAILVYSFLGYLDEEAPLNGRSSIDMILHPSIQMLTEMVVIGYGVQRKSDLTGSVSMINSSEISSTPVIGVVEAMQGRAAGVQITQSSGAPGAASQIRIRGTGTIGNADPLYVIDGMPVDDIGFLNPMDIESISILKDASAAAIYGARAANGVVLITTRRGAVENQTRISYSSYAGIQNITSPYQVLDGRQHAELNIESFVALGAPAASPFHARLYDPECQCYDWSRLPESTNWFNEISRQNAPIQNHYLAAQGGSANAKYLLSFGYFDQAGTINHTGVQKYTFRLNNDFLLSDRLTIGSNLNLGFSERKSMEENDQFAPITEAFLIDPNTPVFYPGPEYVYSSGPTNTWNPVARHVYDNQVGESSFNDLRGNVYADFKILDNLTLKSIYGISQSSNNTHIFLPTFDMPRADQGREIAELYKRERNARNWAWENTITYSQEFDKHSVTALAGFSAYYDRYDWLNLAKSGFPSNDRNFQHLSSALDATASAEGSYVESTMASYLARIIYSYDSRYNATVSMRRDGSSKFGRDNKFGNFPSFSLGWRISEEEFMNRFDWINLLTLRGGWGIIGNNQIALNQFTTLVAVEPFHRYVFGNQIYPGAAPSSAGNSEIKWEESRQVNIGLDVGLWDDRFQINADVFEKNTDGLLVQVPVPLLVGLMQNPTVNAGNIQNRGWELSLTYRNFDRPFKYQVNGNVSRIINKVTDLGRGNEFILTGENMTMVGHPISSFYGWVMDGIFQNWDDVNTHARQNARSAPGDIRFKDINGDGIIDANDRTFIGSPFPDYVFGMTFNFSYGIFDLNIFLQGTQGNEVYNHLARLTSVAGKDNLNISMLDRWTGEGTSNTVPRLVAADNNNNTRISSRYIEDGSYLRIKNVQLGVNLPQRLTQRIGLSNLKVYAAAHNLFTFTKYTGMDPEISMDNRFYATNPLVQGVDRGNYPAAQTIITGIEISF
jgi:TonB-dependent starch-binding outer membrane protein SusC